jgi:hypothetical protein
MEEQELTRFLAENSEYIEEYRELTRLHALAGRSFMEVGSDISELAREELGKALAAESAPGRAQAKAASASGPAGRGPRVLEWIEPFFSPGWAKAAAGLAAGVLRGFFLFSSQGTPGFDGVPDPASLDESTSISDVRFVPLDEEGRQVELSFFYTRKQSFTGSIDSAEVQKLLAYSLARESNPGIRISAVGALRENASSSGPREIRNALLSALLTDSNPVVRGEALAALEAYPPDTHVRGTLINVLRFDRNSKIRLEAIRMLSEMIDQGDPESRENIDALQRQVEVEDNLYLKNQLNTILEKVSLEKL